MSILTISREFGSGGREIGRAVAKLLDYEYADKEKILGDLRAAGEKWEEWGRSLDERCPTIWEKFDWSFRGFGALLQSSILNYALRDRIVIMGRGGNFLLKDIPYALRVRITAPVDARIVRVMDRESVDRETARWLIEKTDNERACFIHSVYGRRWDDPAEYDMTFDTGTQTPDEIAGILKEALVEREKLATGETKRILGMRALAARVKAGIATDPSIFIPTLDVFYEGGSIVLRGVIHNPSEHKRIEEAAKGLAGGMPVKCELHYRR